MNILPGNMRFGAGQPVKRLEDQRLLTGKGQFIDDKPEDGALWLHVLRSPHAHAKIVSIDTKPAAGMPGVEAVYTRTQLEQGMMSNTKLAKQVILAWHQKISGDIVIMNKPNWYLFAKPNTYASTHGSPWSYDTNVPLAMYGPNWIKPGKYGDSEVVDLARTIAFILNVRPPNGCEGRVLSEAMN